MKNTKIGWRKMLYELNEFSCKIEFLQSKMRIQVLAGKISDVDNYINSIKKLVIEHENNLYKEFCDMKINMISNEKPIIGVIYPNLVNPSELAVD